MAKRKKVSFKTKCWKWNKKDSCRVALTPSVAATLVKKGFTVNVEENAGVDAKFRNSDYERSGAKIVNVDTAFNSGN